MLTDRPLVGVAALILRDGQILLGKRTKMPGRNTWQCPGGYLQFNESVFECVRRETQEETGLLIHNLQYGPYTNNRFSTESMHTVSLYVLADYMAGEIQLREQSKAESWGWFDLDKLPQPLFMPLQILLERHDAWFTGLG